MKRYVLTMFICLVLSWVLVAWVGFVSFRPLNDDELFYVGFLVVLPGSLGGLFLSLMVLPILRWLEIRRKRAT